MAEYDPTTNERGCRWHFEEQKGGREDGPNNAMMQNFKANPYKSLVREVIQNSLDAVYNHDEPVKVEFSFSSLTDSNFKNFFELEKHIKECRNYFNTPKANELYSEMEKCFSRQSIKKGIGYIRISDYNTKGMHYDPNSSDSPFYAFARSAGVSAKTDQESGGSFGFGKSAYFQLSPISTIIVSTMTPKGEFNFEGVSWLCTHRYNGIKVNSVGYYDNNGGYPVNEPSNIPPRFSRTEPGTTFFLLGFRMEDKDEAIKEMIKEVLRSFWYAVFQNKLEVTIGEIVINRENLDEYMSKYFDNDIDDTQKSGHLNPRAYYKAVKEAESGNLKARHFRESIPLLGECSIYLIKADCSKDKMIYMRRPLMLVYGKRTQTSYGVFGLFVCENKRGDEILRELENPAHDEWKQTNWRNSRGKIEEKGVQALDEIHKFRQRCFEELFSNSQETALEITGLEDLLYVPEDLLTDNDESDHSLGNPTGNVKDIGTSITTDINKDGVSKKSDDDGANIGSVKITMPGSYEEDTINEEDGDLAGFRERTKRPARNRGGKPRAGDKFINTKIQNPDGTYRTYIPVEFRVMAQKENDKHYHYLLIHAPHDIIEGELELITSGEQSDDVVNLETTDNGTIEGNIIKHVVLEEGRNTIKILFADNMRHAIKLKAYENI